MTRITARPKKSTLKLHMREYLLGNAIRLKSQRLNEVNRSYGSKFTDEGAEDLMRDIFWAYFKDEPELKDVDEIHTGRILNRHAIEWLMARQSYRSGKVNSQGSITVAGQMSEILYETVLKSEEFRKAMEKQRQAEASDNMADIQNRRAEAFRLLAQRQREDGDEDAAKQSEKKANKFAGLESMNRNRADNHREELMEMIRDLEGDAEFQGDVMAAQGQASEKGKEISKTLRTWGIGPGSPEAMDPKMIEHVERAMRPKVREIAEIAGRLRGIAIEARKSRIKQYTPVSAHVGLTRDIGKLFAGERALLRKDAPPVARADAVARFAARGLLGFTPESVGEREGPFVACVDESGSMGGQDEIQAKALALGLARVAKEDSNRPYALISFSSDYGPSGCPTVTSDDPWVKQLSWFEHFANGGTDFNPPLQRAMQECRKLMAEGHAPDVVLITDGDGHLSPETIDQWTEFAQETGARLYYVPVGYDARRGGSLEEMAYKTLDIGSFNDVGQVAQAIGEQWATD